MIAIIIGGVVACMTTLRWPTHFQRAINGVIGRPRETGTDQPPPFFKAKAKERRPDVVEM
jgi:hypothetical protein